MSTANNARLLAEGGVSIQFGGQEKILYFDFTAVCACEHEIRKAGIGKGLADLVIWSKDFKDFSISIEGTAIILWAGMLHYDNGQTVAQVGKVIWEDKSKVSPLLSVQEYVADAMVALSRIRPEPDKEVEGTGRPLAAATAPKPSIGKPSLNKQPSKVSPPQSSGGSPRSSTSTLPEAK